MSNQIREIIYQQIDAERDRQDKQWGGGGHDDDHDARDWLNFIDEHNARAKKALAKRTGQREATPDYDEYRKQLVEVAALAVAAIEARDRVTRRKDGWANAMTGIKDLRSPPAETFYDPHRKEQHGIPMLLWCPECGARHVDLGEFATKVHRDHACQNCGLVWRPALVPTVGVQFLPGFKNEVA